MCGNSQAIVIRRSNCISNSIPPTHCIPLCNPVNHIPWIDAARRKPGPKPRRVPQNSVPVPASPSPSLAQLFAAADSPQRPSSGSEESESASTTHHKDGRPRNLGRGVSKPKKNTVASLLAQSRALGIKPTPTLDPSVPLSHQVSLLRSNILAAQLHASATGQGDDKNQVKARAGRREVCFLT